MRTWQHGTIDTAMTMITIDDGPDNGNEPNNDKNTRKVLAEDVNGC
jgi:hypothetical protein